MFDPRETVLHRLQTIKDLPRLPESVIRLEEIANDAHASAREIVDVLESDPPIAAKLLSLANSAYYARSADWKISSLQQAVVRLGVREIRRVCLAIGSLRLFVRPSRLIEHKAFWRHSLTVANATRTVARRAKQNKVDENEAFVAGLLHELGTLVLDQYFERIYNLISSECHRSERPIHLVEQEYLHLTHAEVGALLLERWKLPASLVAAVRWHHDPSQSPPAVRSLCQLVHIADHSCTSQGNAGPGEEYPFAMNLRAWSDLGLEMKDMYSLLDDVAVDAQQASTFIAAAA